jgi:hypothetical protein
LGKLADENILPGISKDIHAIFDRERVDLGRSVEIEFVSKAVNVLVLAR